MQEGRGGIGGPEGEVQVLATPYDFSIPYDLSMGHEHCKFIDKCKANLKRE